MNTNTDNPHAFPGIEIVYPTGKPLEEHYPGMTLRDWFAGQALASMTAAPDYSKGPCNEAMAERAYVIADAMLRARQQKD